MFDHMFCHLLFKISGVLVAKNTTKFTSEPLTLSDCCWVLGRLCTVTKNESSESDVNQYKCSLEKQKLKYLKLKLSEELQSCRELHASSDNSLWFHD